MNIKFVTNNKAHFEKIGWDSFAEVNEVIKYFDGKPIIAYDSETSGLGFMFSDMWCIQLGDSENQFVVDLKSINIISFKNLLETKILLGHNILFDIVFLYKEGIYPYKIYDTFLAESLLSQGIRIHVRTLKACLKRYLDIELGKEERTNIHNNEQENFLLKTNRSIGDNGGDWRSKSLPPMLMFSTTLNGFYFANCVLNAVVFLCVLLF